MAPAEPVLPAADAAQPAKAGDGDAWTEPSFITVELVFGAAPRQVDRLNLRLPAGATALMALRASGFGERLVGRLGAAAFDDLTLGLSGRLCEPGTVLRDQDRLELLRPLQADPMEARRRRLRRDGLRKTSRKTARMAQSRSA